jgi:hypothetical protein
VQIRRNRQVVLASMLAAMAPVFVSSHAIGQTATDSASRGETADQASTVAAARSLAQQGVRLAESGQCAEAVSKLERAEALRHSAIVAEQLGTCYIALGRLVEGTEMFRAVLREAMPAAASPALSRAYERAEQGLRNERRRIGSLIVNIVGPGDAAVELDGKLFPTALLGAARPTDPGAHALEVTALGYLPKHEALVLAPGEHREISLRLVKDPAYVAAADSSAGPAQNRLAASSSALPVAGVPAKSGRVSLSARFLPRMTSTTTAKATSVPRRSAALSTTASATATWRRACSRAGGQQWSPALSSSSWQDPTRA